MFEYESVLDTYPYIFEVENKGKNLVKYQIKLINEEFLNLEKKDLNYILFLDDVEIKRGSLDDVDNNILYESKIKNGKKNIYKLYIFVNKELEDVSYKYSLEIISN